MFTVGTQKNTMMIDGDITHTNKMAATAYTESFYVDTKLGTATVSQATFKVIHCIRSTTRYLFNQRHTISSHDSKHTQNQTADLKCNITLQQANGFNASKN
jgi:hypothetical protein